jgi:hypothetical protein
MIPHIARRVSSTSWTRHRTLLHDASDLFARCVATTYLYVYICIGRHSGWFASYKAWGAWLVGSAVVATIASTSGCCYCRWLLLLLGAAARCWLLAAGCCWWRTTINDCCNATGCCLAGQLYTGTNSDSARHEYVRICFTAVLHQLYNILQHGPFQKC